MTLLHPDKIVGVTRAVQTRPQRPRRSVEQRAMSAASNRGTGVGKASKAQPGLIENMAFEMRDAHWSNHLDRLSRRVDKAVKSRQSAPTKRVPQGAPALAIRLEAAGAQNRLG